MLTNKRTVPVEFGHCDPSGIVFNPYYFMWFDFSFHALLARGGVTLKSMIAELGLDGIPLVTNSSRFLAPSRWGDTLLIETSAVALHRCTIDIRHRVFNGDVLAVECTETRACTAVDPRTGRIRAHPLPQQLIDALSGDGEDHPP